MSSQRKGTYWEDDDDIFFPFHDDSQIESDFEAFESFVDEDVLNCSSRNEACGRS